jgi:two-component system, NarL family, invasion response regulator UvrY
MKIQPGSAARSKINVALIDPTAIVREALHRLIDGLDGIHVAEVASNFESAFGQGRRPQADVGVIRMRLLESVPLTATQPIPLLFLISKNEVPSAVRAAAMGGSRIGFLDEESSAEELRLAIRSLAQGRAYTCGAVASALAQEAMKEKPRLTLSRRESEILRFTAQGLSRAEIARRIAVSTKTVSTYKRRISMKTGLRNAAEITHYAIDQHIID